MNMRLARREPYRDSRHDGEIEEARKAVNKSTARSVRDLAEQRRLLDTESVILHGLVQAATAELGAADSRRTVYERKFSCHGKSAGDSIKVF